MKHIVKQGDVVMVYEGTSEEIATFIHYEENGIDINVELLDKKELVYDQEEAVEFIESKLLEHDYLTVDKLFIHRVLDADEDYMRSKGIIDD